MENILILFFWIVVVGGVIIYSLLKKNRNRKAAQGGEDKARIRQALERVLGDSGDYQLAYAHWEEQESYGRTVRTTYYRYAVAYKERILWVFPLGIDKKTREIQVGRPITLTNENLGKITVKTREKKGLLNKVEVWLGDKQGHVIVQFDVNAENLRDSRYYPVNLFQQEECQAFERFITPLSQQIASENPDVDAMLAEEAKEGMGIGGVIVSAVGVVGGICVPPVGVILCLIGMIVALIGKMRGAKTKKWLIISVVCMVWSVVYCWIYIKYLFI